MPDPDWNPYFRLVYDYCKAKPMAVEDHPWGETVFKLGGKVFAFLGHHDRGGVTVKVTPDQIDSSWHSRSSAARPTSAAMAGSPSRLTTTARSNSRWS